MISIRAPAFGGAQLQRACSRMPSAKRPLLSSASRPFDLSAAAGAQLGTGTALTRLELKPLSPGLARGPQFASALALPLGLRSHASAAACGSATAAAFSSLQPRTRPAAPVKASVGLAGAVAIARPWAVGLRAAVARHSTSGVGQGPEREALGAGNESKVEAKAGEVDAKGLETSKGAPNSERPAPKYPYGWDVPWGAGTTAAAYILSHISGLVAFGGVLGIGYVLNLLELLSTSSLNSFFGSYANLPAYLRISVYLIPMMGINLFVLHRYLKPYPLAKHGLFRYTPSLKAVVAGVAAFAFWLALDQTLVKAVMSALGATASAISQTQPDPINLPFVFVFNVILAPILEETMYRGFLLPSLTKHVPTWAAIALSSLPLWTLISLLTNVMLPASAVNLVTSELVPLVTTCLQGCLYGFIYTRSRSLAAPIVANSLWNLFVWAQRFGILGMQIYS